MSGPHVEKLLHLQERDTHRSNIRRQLESFPGERAALERHIAEHKNQVAVAREQHRSLELARSDLEGQIASEEDQRRRYRTQQMSVKRNEEYKALEHQISACSDRITQLEEREIEVLLQIDDAAKTVSRCQEEATEAIDVLQHQIDRLSEGEAHAQEQLADAESQARLAEAEVEPTLLREYQYVATRVKKPPYVVPIVDRQCQGCFIRVSAEVESEARKKDGVSRCDSCGRIIYIA